MNKNVINKMGKLEEGFFGFWVKKAKVSYLLIILLLFTGIYSLLSIPKESTPEISFGIIGIITTYPGVNPTDIDSLITEKIEKEIKSVDGIKKISSTSSIGVSQVIVELTESANIKDVVNDIRNDIAMISFPDDANDPVIMEIESATDLMFEVILYGDAEKYTQFDLIQRAQLIKSTLEGTISGLSGIDVGGFNPYSTMSYDYDILVLLDKGKIEQLNLSIPQIASIIRSYNRNTPIGNHSIGDLNYDFRFEGEFTDIEELKNTVIRSSGDSNILLKDIAKFERKYEDNAIRKVGFENEVGLNYISLAFRKNEGTNVFSVSGPAKEAIEHLIDTNPVFKDLKIAYTTDLSAYILDDYKTVGSTGLQTVISVFLILFIFIGFKESILAAIMIPLSFLITFIVLYFGGYTMNFLTNFGLVLSLGITIDVTIVIIEAASEKIKLGYSKKAAVLLAVREFLAPLISGTMTTLVAFFPLMFLPGPMGKVMAYMPITVFATLGAALILAVTLGSALFIIVMKDSHYYRPDKKLEDTFSEEDRDFLDYEREGKELKVANKRGIRDKILKRLSDGYYNILDYIVSSKWKRIFVTILPFILTILSLIFISPKLGFTLFPEGDNGQVQVTIEAQEGTNKEALQKYISLIDDTLYGVPELKIYTISISGNQISIYVELLEKNERKELGLRNVFEIEKLITEKLKSIESDGLGLSINTTGGMSSGKAVGIKLIASNSSKVNELKDVANDLKNYLSTIDGVKNAETSGTDSPGQFIFKFDREKLSQIGLTPSDILTEVYYYISGLNAGAIKSTYEDNDIVLKIAQFEDNLSPDDVSNLIVNTPVGKIRVGDFAKYEFDKSITAITRENTRIMINVEADVIQGVLPSAVQPVFEDYAAHYNYPDGISYSKGGETVENAELINAVLFSFGVAVFLIFFILVLQFNSYSQPLIIVYSIILGLLGVNVGLYLTGNPYSLTFMIGFVALTGIIVNNAILLVDRINKNIEQGLEPLYAVTSSGKSRLQPIIITTLTTIVGVLPLAMQDEFWAGLGYTIVFGLAFGAFMTLFVVPSLYYTVYVVRKQKKEKKRLEKEKKKMEKQAKKIEQIINLTE